MAAAGIPDYGDCNIGGNGIFLTGVTTGCVSAKGMVDMVGNVWEWVDDWGTIGGTVNGLNGTSVRSEEHTSELQSH